MGATSAVVLGGWMLRRSRHGDSKCNGRIGFVIVCAYEDVECRMGWGRGLISWKLREGQEGRGGSTRGLQVFRSVGHFHGSDAVESSVGAVAIGALCREAGLLQTEGPLGRCWSHGVWRHPAVLCRRLPCNLLPPFCNSDTPPSAEQKNAIAVAHVKAGKGLLKVRPPLTAPDMLVLQHVFPRGPRGVQH